MFFFRAIIRQGFDLDLFSTIILVICDSVLYLQSEDINVCTLNVLWKSYMSVLKDGI